jgi:mono/diheme cytochrome c family protein
MPTLSRRSWTLAALIVAAMGGAIGSACDGLYSATEGGGSRDGGAGDPHAIAKAAFDANVRPFLQSVCAVCHGSGAPAYPQFLTPPDIYASLMATPTLVVPGNPDASRLYVYGQSQAHSGTKLTTDQAAAIRAWILLEPSATPTGGGVANTSLMTPVTGANTVDLSQVNAALVGAKLTFNYQPLTGGMYMSQLKVTAGSGMGVHLLHPLFVYYPTPTDPRVDPVDSFYGFEASIPASMSGTLGGGSVALTNVPAGSQLSIRFEKLEPMSGTGPDGGTGLSGGCKDVADFTSLARPQLMMSCTSCHGGSNASATAGYDLRALADTSAASQAQACGQTKGKINFADPPNSILFQRPKPPQMTGHAFTFPDLTTYQAFANPILSWVAKENM